MSRFYASIGILAGLIAVSVLSLFLLKSECSRYSGYVQDAEQAYASGDTAAALAAFDRLEDGWESFHNVTGLFVDGGKLDVIYEHLTVLRPLIGAEHDEVPSELECVRRLIEGISEEELPLIWHIL